MTRITKPGEILAQPGREGEIVGPVGTVGPGGGDDFLSRVNLTITNFKSLMSAVKEFRGMADQKDETKLGGNNPPSSSVGAFIQALITAGYGDTPVGDILEQVKPYTISQLIGMAKSAGLKR